MARTWVVLTQEKPKRYYLDRFRRSAPLGECRTFRTKDRAINKMEKNGVCGYKLIKADIAVCV